MRQLVFILALLLGACSDSPALPDAALDGGAGDGRRDTSADLLAPDWIVPGTDRCLGAAPAGLAGIGKVELQGSTAGASNEYGSGIRCGETTPLIGPQRYYRLELQAGLTYRFELRPSFQAVLILSASCGASAINTECGSQGAMGASSGPIAAGQSGVIFFRAPASGSYRLAVESASSDQAGPFQLTLEGFSAPANATCAKAEALTLPAGLLTVEGSTMGADSEFTQPGQELSCGLGIDLDGPQVYYTAALSAGSWYRLGLAPDFPAALYLASSAADCKPANLEADCSSLGGTVLPPVPAGTQASTAFSPPQSGSYLIAVESPDPGAAGSFRLELEPFTPPPGMICAEAAALSFSGPSATVTGDTTTHLNDRGAQVRCGAALPLLGPQAYFKVELKAVVYQLLLKPGFDAVLAVGQSCQGLPADCGSGGLAGTSLSVAAGQTGAVLFKPSAAGPHILAVDTLGGPGGPFSLEVKEHQPPAHGVCGQPRLLTLSSGSALEAGDTSPFQNDLGGVSCGLTGVGPWSGPQAYYRVLLEAGKTYQVELQPEASFDPALYAFPAGTACTAAAVNAACTSRASDKLGPGLSEGLLLSPGSTGEMILVVDSWSVSEVGSFTLSITQK